MQQLFCYPHIWAQQGTEEGREAGNARLVSARALRQADSDVPMEAAVWLVSTVLDGANCPSGRRR